MLPVLRRARGAAAALSHLLVQARPAWLPRAARRSAHTAFTELATACRQGDAELGTAGPDRGCARQQHTRAPRLEERTSQGASWRLLCLLTGDWTPALVALWLLSGKTDQ